VHSVQYGKKPGLGLSTVSLQFFRLSLTRETWTQELLQVVKAIVSLPDSVPPFINTRCLRVDISILYHLCHFYYFSVPVL
jgi:hypothetical protein